MMKLSFDKIKFVSGMITSTEVIKMVQEADIISAFSLIHHISHEIGIKEAKNTLRYVFTVKEVILEQGYFTYNEFVEWTGITDYPKQMYKMDDPLVLNLMVKACIGFVPDYKVLGSTPYRQNDGIEYNRVIIHYINDPFVKLVVHDDGQANCLWKHHNRVFKFIPNILKRMADYAGNQRLGRRMEIHGDVFSMPYFDGFNHEELTLFLKDANNREITKQRIMKALDTLNSVGVIKNDISSGMIISKDHVELIDFETATIDSDYADFIRRTSSNDINAALHYINPHYFKSKAKEMIGTVGMVGLNKMFVDYIFSKPEVNIS